MFQAGADEFRRGRDQLNIEIFSLKTEKDSLLEKLNEVSNQLAATGEEKNKFEKLSEKLEKEKSEVEEKSKQQENKIEELLKLHEVILKYFYHDKTQLSLHVLRLSKLRCDSNIKTCKFGWKIFSILSA